MPSPMGGSARDRSSRSGRKSRAASRNAVDSAAPPMLSPSSFPFPSPAGLDAAAAAGIDFDPSVVFPPIANPVSGGGYDESGWPCCTEDQLEEFLLKNLDLVYKEALSRLVSLGYDEDAALRAVLCSGHCYGSLDVLSNILQNAIRYLSSIPDPSACSSSSDSAGGGGGGFTDLRHLEEYSLAGLVCLLQQLRPSLSRRDAMWCLLMSELQVGRASTMDIPVGPAPSATFPAPPPSVVAAAGGDLLSGDMGTQRAFCQFHAAAAAAGHGDVDPGLLDPSAFMSFAMKPNASGLHPTHAARFFPPQTWLRTDQHPTEGDKQTPIDAPPLELVDSVLKELEGLSLEEKSADGKADPKTDMIYDLVRQIRELEVQVKERKEWAQQKALQAARKLGNDLMELKMLRMEREENQRRKKEKQALEDETVKRLAELEGALKKVKSQVDRANAVVCQLEMENAEIRAEMEAAKLSASESMKTCQELAKKEKKHSKKLQSCEKQKQKMQEQSRELKVTIGQTEQHIVEMKLAIKETEVKFTEAAQAKEQAILLAEEEKRATEATKAGAQRRLGALRHKIETDSQCYKDDIRRLEEELTRLQASAGSTQPNPQPINGASTDATRPPKDSNRKGPAKSDKLQEPSLKTNHRRCVVCTKDEVCVLLLPCAHQVLCADCSKDHERRGASACPCCNTRIDQRIRVYGASS